MSGDPDMVDTADMVYGLSILGVVILCGLYLVDRKWPLPPLILWVLVPVLGCAIVIVPFGYTFSHGTDSTLAYYIIAVVFVPPMAFVTLDDIRKTRAKHREERNENHHPDDE